jgi:hypothetical protein
LKFEEVECSDGAEGCGVGSLWPAVVGVHAPPGLEVGDRAFDHIADLVDGGVEFLLPIEEFSAGRLPERGGYTGPDVALSASAVGRKRT